MIGWLGISLGDATGIGAEVTLKALAAEGQADDTRYLLIGDVDRVHKLNQQLDLNLSIRPFPGSTDTGRLFIHNPLQTPLPAPLEPDSPAVANAAVAWLRDGAERCLRQELDGLVTAPVNKHAIVRAGHPFIGQTEFLSQLAGTERTAMMLLGHDDRGRWLRVSLVTTHLPLRRVAENITQAKVEQVIELTAQSCRDLGLPRARVAVCGLNPHAGEGGEFGSEDQEIILPAVLASAQRNLDVIGPLPGDTVFYQAFRGAYDAVVAMYHDQGLAPLKLIGFETGVNWTLGLPFIRTSPDHGTAYDIASKGVADPSSMRAAIRLARHLARKRG